MMPEENDGYLLAKIPTSWLKISHRVISDEQREAARERFAKYHEQKQEEINE